MTSTWGIGDSRNVDSWYSQGQEESQTITDYRKLCGCQRAKWWRFRGGGSEVGGKPNDDNWWDRGGAYSLSNWWRHHLHLRYICTALFTGWMLFECCYKTVLVFTTVAKASDCIAKRGWDFYRCKFDSEGFFLLSKWIRHSIRSHYNPPPPRQSSPIHDPAALHAQ